MIDFKAAIFDLDGTILDSMEVWKKIDVVFCAKRNLVAPESYSHDISGMSYYETAVYTKKLFNLPDSPEELITEWNDMALEEYKYRVSLKPYAKEYLLALKARGINLATATNLTDGLAVPALKNNGIYDLFDAHCYTGEVGKSKSFPDVYLLAAKKLSVLPEECIVFEDVLPGVLSAKTAKMRVYCIHDKYSARYEKEMREKADGYLYDFQNAPKPTITEVNI